MIVGSNLRCWYYLPVQSAARSAPAEPILTRSNRWITFLEVLLGAFIVIGHNVFHVIPNEVPILFVLFWISPRIREGKWNLQGLRSPNSWLKTLVMAILAAVVLQLGSELLIQPL